MKNMLSSSCNRSHTSDSNTNSRSGEFNNLVNYLWNYFEQPSNVWDSQTTGDWEPSIQVVENKDAVNVTAELPGINEKDLDLQISSDGLLTLSGEKKNTYEIAEKDAYFSEISYGSFKRTIPLPWDLDYDSAVANFHDGLLTISIPKSPEEKQKFRKLEIKKNN